MTPTHEQGTSFVDGLIRLGATPDAGEIALHMPGKHTQSDHAGSSGGGSGGSGGGGGGGAGMPATVKADVAKLSTATGGKAGRELGEKIATSLKDASPAAVTATMDAMRGKLTEHRDAQRTIQDKLKASATPFNERAGLTEQLRAVEGRQLATLEAMRPVGEIANRQWTERANRERPAEMAAARTAAQRAFQAELERGLNRRGGSAR